jgi:hypothetical protein
VGISSGQSGRGRQCAPGPEAMTWSEGSSRGRSDQAASRVCSVCGSVLWEKRSWSRAKRLSGIDGALRRRRCASSVGGVEDLKRASGKNLLSVEWAARPDIYIGARCTMHVR